MQMPESEPKYCTMYLHALSLPLGESAPDELEHAEAEQSVLLITQQVTATVCDCCPTLFESRECCCSFFVTAVTRFISGVKEL